MSRRSEQREQSRTSEHLKDNKSLSSASSSSFEATTAIPATTAASAVAELESAGRQRQSFVGAGKLISCDQGPRAASATSGAQRLSSFEILSENKQRQFKQQESFKLHLEQRQKKLIERQQQQQGAKTRHSSDTSNDEDLGVTYQVNTSVPDFMASAQAKSGGAGSGKTSLAINPFDEEARRGAAAGQRDEAVSGKSGFLSALMDEASFEQEQASQLSDRSSNDREPTNRYQNLHRDYTYEKRPDKRPFYQKDFGTLLQECRASRKLVIAIVAIALLLDNMLLTSVVPIIPFDLLRNRKERELKQGFSTSSLISANSSARPRGPGEPSSGKEVGEMDEEQLARMLELFLANAKQRYSGSVFHPRIRPAEGGSESFEGEDGDGAPNDNGRSARRKSKSSADSNEGAATGRRGKVNKFQSAAGALSDRDEDDDDRTIRDEPEVESDANSKQSLKLAKDSDTDAGDDDDDDDDDDRQPNSEREQVEAGGRSRKLASKNVDKPMRSGKAKYGLDGGKKAGSNENKADSFDDDDDEDSANSKLWLKLKSSLSSMAAARGNSSADLSLANMCLNMVLNSDAQNAADSAAADSDSYDDAIPEQAPENSVARKQARVNQTSGRKQSSRQARAARLIQLKARKKVNPANSSSDSSGSQAATPNAAAAADKTTSFEGPGRRANSVAGLDAIGSISHQDIVDESFEVGVMFASKPIVQAFANPFIGTLTNKVGFTIPMFTGFVIMFISTLVFAFGSSFSTLFCARAIQGVGSACTSVAGMSMLADRFPDDAERGHAMAIALGGLALGVVIGPPFGGLMYQFVGRSSPFIVLSILALLDGLLQLLVLQPSVNKSPEEGASLMTLIKDPYILVAAGAITFANTGIAILEPTLPLWMMDTMGAENWEQGVAFLPAALSYMFGTNLFGNMGLKIGRWRSAMIGLLVIGCSLLLIPFASRVEHLIIPNGAIGFAMGMVDSTMMPMLGYLVDIRHTSVYGSVYAIGDVAFCASFAFGPVLSGTLVRLIGFEGLIITTAIICFAFAPLLFLLRNPPPREAISEAQLREQSALRYVNYNQLDYSLDDEGHLTGGGTNCNKKSSLEQKTYVR